MTSHVAAFVALLATVFEAAYRDSCGGQRPQPPEHGDVIEGSFDMGLDEVPPTGTAHWHIRAEELGRRLAGRMPRGWRRSKLLSRVEGNRLFLWVEAHRRANANVPQ